MQTTAGRVDFVTKAASGLIAGLAMDRGLDNFRPPEQQKGVLVHLSGRPGRMVSIAVHGRDIVGYAGFRGREDRCPGLYELQGIEVASRWRKLGVAGGLLAATFQGPPFDDCVVYVTGEPRYWDLAGTGMNVWRYRRSLARLYGSVGFTARSVRRDVLSNVANLLMVRAGRNVAEGWEARCHPLLGIEGPDLILGNAGGPESRRSRSARCPAGEDGSGGNHGSVALGEFPGHVDKPADRVYD